MTATLSATSREDFRLALRNAGLTSIADDILTKVVALAQSLKVSPTALAEIWEAYSLTKNVQVLDAHSFAAFRLKVMSDADVRMNESAVKVVSMVTPHSNNKFGDPLRRVSLSPAAPQFAPMTASSSTLLSSYSERKDVGKVLCTREATLRSASAVQTPQNVAPKCRISTEPFQGSNVPEPYRHWYTVLDDRSAALDRQYHAHVDAMAAMYPFGTEGQLAALEEVGVPRQETICCIGRIVNAAHHGRINATSVQLEGSRHGSGGARVDVDLSHMKGQSYSLFPGQIVAIEGINSSGRKLVAQRICEGAPHPPVQSSVQKLLQFHYSDQEGAPLRVITASGPFTCSTNLDYEPWIDLLNHLMTQKPDVVILTGPFVDMNHSSVQAGQTTLRFENPDGLSQEDVVVPYESFFATKIAGAIEDLLAADDGPQHTQFVLVPSLDDATADWVYPQPPFTESHSLGTFLPIAGGGDVTVGTLGLGSLGEHRIHCLPNPCTFCINEIVFGVTGTDVLFHMSAEETNAHLEAGSRMNRIAQHLLQQRSYYPLFPAGGNTQLNLQFMEQWQIPCAPDILICPSKLAPFASPLLDGNTLVLNPGSLARAHTGGSFAILEIHPLPRTTLEEAGGADVLLPHQVVQRTAVEIRKI